MGQTFPSANIAKSATPATAQGGAHLCHRAFRPHRSLLLFRPTANAQRLHGHIGHWHLRRKRRKNSQPHPSVRPTRLCRAEITRGMRTERYPYHPARLSAHIKKIGRIGNCHTFTIGHSGHCYQHEIAAKTAKKLPSSPATSRHLPPHRRKNRQNRQLPHIHNRPNRPLPFSRECAHFQPKISETAHCAPLAILLQYSPLPNRQAESVRWPATAAHRKHTERGITWASSDHRRASQPVAVLGATSPTTNTPAGANSSSCATARPTSTSNISCQASSPVSPSTTKASAKRKPPPPPCATCPSPPSSPRPLNAPCKPQVTSTPAVG
ncbi:MAG: hypothetical protein OJF49_003385 [Ktedonobacterales bacterium]|nr:MAG: hypothetical protein OJF49_003385 [Ktedonobacterales bacterium]